MKAGGGGGGKKGEGRAGGLHPMSSFDFHGRASEDLTFKKRAEEKSTNMERDREVALVTCDQLGK